MFLVILGRSYDTDVCPSASFYTKFGYMVFDAGIIIKKSLIDLWVMIDLWTKLGSLFPP